MKFAPSTARIEARRIALASRRAFTLVEILAALLMMAIIIPVAMEGMSIATRAGILGQRKAAAMRVAERVLNELLVEGETARASTTGSTTDGDTTYAWSMRSENWPEDPMMHLTVTVTFTVQGNDYTVDLSTLIPPSSADLDAMGASTTQ
jgi:prepilin-type N-terminal cleavage/methylation domain-containing protein